MESSPSSSPSEIWKESSSNDEHIITENGNGEILVSEAGDHYEYFIDENIANSQRRMIRMLRGISRMGSITNGIYHPTLVPSEDKRIAGVSGILKLKNSLLKRNILNY